MALENKNDQIADLLMNKGADINIGTFGGTTPLHIAAQDGNLSLVKTFISKGAYLHAKNADSESAKDVASSDEVCFIGFAVLFQLFVSMAFVVLFQKREASEHFAKGIPFD